jgi:hypothetical protein
MLLALFEHGEPRASTLAGCGQQLARLAVHASCGPQITCGPRMSALPRAYSARLRSAPCSDGRANAPCST